ncbi:MAG: hypothetical protein PVH12_00435 [Candidatus Bathyarchaeota archaeon]
MKGKSHKRITELAFSLLSEIEENFSLRDSRIRIQVSRQSVNVDYVKDLEFVDVDAERDNPHKDDGFLVDDDRAHYHAIKVAKVFSTGYFTSFNHFIDIRKGPGIFDDYDGYSYHRGSGSKGEYEKKMFNGVDWWINWWYRDEYVHVPGQKWYQDCSPSVIRYSFPHDKGIYKRSDSEATKRFPLAERVKKMNQGIPYSVFMPVDNLARYWFKHYVANSGKPKDLGYVMHAIQDASIPQHAAGCCGNWHAKYEKSLEKKIISWVADVTFKNNVKTLFNQWNKLDSTPPKSLNVADYNKEPKINWKIEWLVTWVALKAYHAYESVYDYFKDGWSFRETSAKKLAQIATAMSMLTLLKAVQ